MKKRIERIFKCMEIKNKAVLEIQEKYLNLFLDENILT